MQDNKMPVKTLKKKTSKHLYQDKVASRTKKISFLLLFDEIEVNHLM